MITVNLVDCWLVVKLGLGKYGVSCDIMWEMAFNLAWYSAFTLALTGFLNVNKCSIYIIF